VTETEQQTQTDSRLTNSSMGTAKTCLKKFWFRYILGIDRDVEPDYFRFGHAWHLGVEKLPDESIYDTIRKNYEDLAATMERPDLREKLRLECEIVCRLLAGWQWRWGAAPLEVVAAELSFEIPIVNPDTDRSSRTYTLAGKIDKILRLPDGRLAEGEHKSTSDDISPESDYWKRLRIDHQITTYMVAARQIGHPAETVIYDVVHKPGIRPKKLTQAETAKFITGGWKYFDETFKAVKVAEETWTLNGELLEIDRSGKLPAARETIAMFGARLTADIGERPDYYFARREIPRTEGDIDDFRQELWMMAGLLRDCAKYGRYPRNTGACLARARCTYFDICTTGYDPNVVPAGFVKLDTLHPEIDEISEE